MRRRRKNTARSIGLAVILVIAGAAVGIQSILFPISPLDSLGARIAAWTAAQDESIISIVRFLTSLGDAWVISMLGVLSVGASALRKGSMSRTSTMPAAGMLGVWLLGEAIKALVSRDRPIIPWLIDKSAASGHSFPSAHAMSSMGSYMIVAATMPARLRKPLRLLAFSISIIIGLSRVALGVHYFSDVIAGWCFGFAYAQVYRLLLSSKWIKRGINAAGKMRGFQ